MGVKRMLQFNFHLFHCGSGNYGILLSRTKRPSSASIPFSKQLCENEFLDLIIVYVSSC